MLSPTGWWLVTAPVDLRGGMDRLWLHVRGHLQQDPVHGGAYVFRNRAGTRIKVLHVDPHGVWLAVRRLHEGRFHRPRSGDAAWSLDRSQFQWLIQGVDWQRLSRTQVLTPQL